VLVALVLFCPWICADETQQRRIDRAADRNGDAALPPTTIDSPATPSDDPSSGSA
jgi:hypothetical protein